MSVLSCLLLGLLLVCVVDVFLVFIGMLYFDDVCLFYLVKCLLVNVWIDVVKDDLC